MWYSVNGERLGTYNGHTGAVWCVDCDCILSLQMHLFMFVSDKMQGLILYSCDAVCLVVLAGFIRAGLLNVLPQGTLKTY